MNFKFWQTEQRDSSETYTDAVVRLLQAHATQTATTVTSTAALEAASGALSRAFSAAKVSGPTWAQSAISPAFLSQVGRGLVRDGESMHRIDVNHMGRVRLIPASDWDFEGKDSPDTWKVRVSTYGPSTGLTHNLDFAGVVYVQWGSTPGQPYRGVGPLTWASTTAKLQAEAERSLADEAAGPIAQILSIPQEGGDDEDGDPLTLLKADIRNARGRALLLETTAAGWGEGMASSPRRDWVASRLGPMPPEAMVNLRSDAFQAVLAATGTPPSLFLDSDGTAQREAVRRWHQNVVLPMAGMLQTELSEKLETDISLTFDNYPLDLAGRAQAFQKLVAGGVGVNEALATSGLLADA